jgi:D-sedoheptulose 7-phosphate isomerase|tara:strand:- start:30 stop:596 length:567 start_codon:yes stop_codon:yes gene_type:complete
MGDIGIEWIEDYLNKYKEAIFNRSVYGELLEAKQLFEETSKVGGKVILAGNGGSAAIASHCSVDLTKNAGIRAINFNEADLITCFANDYGYDQWISKALDFYSNDKDTVVLISSSGKSSNILKAAKRANENEINLVTFSGFDPSNLLRKEGKINFWVDSKAYNIVEMTHHIWLLTIVDMIIGSAEYPS